MSKVTVSDFVIALLDLFEAESRSFQESVSLFLEEQRNEFITTGYQGIWMAAWVLAAIVSVIGAMGFFVWGCYQIFLHYLSPLAAPFATAAILILFAFLFGYLAGKKEKNESR